MVLASITPCASLTILGCGSKVEGTYVNATGMAAIEFKSGKAYLTMGVVTQEAEYEVKGDKVIIRESKDDPSADLALAHRRISPPART